MFGYDRGQPVDRYYVDGFLSAYADDIFGITMEIGDDRYTREFGGAAVTRADVLDVDRSNPRATLFADLSDADHLESEQFDAIICTQTLLLVYDVHTAVRALHRLLRPGGVLLVTVPGISRICPSDHEDWLDFWRFTSHSARRLFTDVFGDDVTVEQYGNVLSAAAALYGLAAEELSKEELDAEDPLYEVIVGVRAVKAQPSAQ